MKFELNKRTGMMEPKKDDQIYFAGSMGGGLRIDDRKNNVKYIIERDETITNLFGLRNGQVNIYDMRDARMIADRVLRKFGGNNKFKDYHYFLKGYHMSESFIKNYDEFVNETVFGDMLKRSYSDTSRKEDGRFVATIKDVGTLTISPDYYTSQIVEFDGNPYIYIEDIDAYVVVFENGSYFRFDPDIDDGPTLVPYFNAPHKLIDSNFAQIRILASECNYTAEDFDDVDIVFTDEYAYVTLTSGEEYFIFDDEDVATEHAINDTKDLLESYKPGKDDFNRWRGLFGDDFLDVDGINDALKESFETYIDDLDYEDKIEEFINCELIEKTEEYFGVDEDDEIDIWDTKFDEDEMSEKYVENRMNQVLDPVEEMEFQYGIEELIEYIDYDKLAELCVNMDGRGNSIASYDSKEIEVSFEGTYYYIYRIN